MIYKTLALVILVFAELCLAQNSRIIDISPSSIKNPGDDIVLNCTVEKPKELMVSWTKSGAMLSLETLSTFPRYSVVVDPVSKTYSLIINNLTATDSGKYACEVNVAENTKISKELDLQVTRAPSILDLTETNVKVAEGQTATLHCQADGYPKPRVTWKRDDETILFTKETTYRGANLTILLVKKEDRGRYTCEAENGIGSVAKKSVLLEVSFSPILSAKRPKTGQKEGYEAHLICKVTSYPPAAISWVRKGKEVNNDDNYEISFTGETNELTTSVLKLKSVQQHHYGDYTCKASNPFGYNETILELFEQELPNEFFSVFGKSNGHRFIGFHSTLYAVIGIITFTLFR